MATSTIPAVKAALVSLIGAALPGVQVTWSTPREDKQPEWIRVGDVRGRQAAARIGRQARKETYTVEIHVSLVKSDVEDPRVLTDRAFELVGEIEDVLRADETLGGVPGLIWAVVEKSDLSEGVAGGERWSEVVVHVGCESRI